jgi:hypothetical protein
VPINFISNDPLAQDDMPMRQQIPRPDRKGNVARFDFGNLPREKVYDFGSLEFLSSQCREAALSAITVFETLNGPLREWSQNLTNRKTLPININAGTILNAQYDLDTQALLFYINESPKKTTYSAASTDVVAHETGHALLDAIRPELIESFTLEVNAFHEAFGDCMSILTALSDDASRDKVLPNLQAANFVETTAEDLADSVRLLKGPTHPAALPRHALNRYQWQLPTTLPPIAPPPTLIDEAHSFAQVFTGCFYDLIQNLFDSLPVKDSDNLLKAAQTAGRLLVAAAQKAPVTMRFYQQVGRSMVLIDNDQNSGGNRDAIRRAFERHGIALGSAAMLAPIATLAGDLPRFAARSVDLPKATRDDLRRRLSARPGARMAVNAVSLGGKRFAEVVHKRPVDLSRIDKALKGVVAMTPETVLVGSSARKAAILDGMPDENITTDEVLTFVNGLLKNGRIELDGAKKGAIASADTEVTVYRPTHRIVTEGKQRVLKRVRFSCAGSLDVRQRRE